MEFVFITGMSGAGKSQAMKVMEDMNYYCMDNLPPALFKKFAELCMESKKDIGKVAVVVDIRAGGFFDHLFDELKELENRGISYKILFLDADDKTLIKRYKELRRPHPLNPDGNIIDGIKKERNFLYEIKMNSDYTINTSNLNLGGLKEEIHNIFLGEEEDRSLSVVVTSFGFKHGMLLDGDLIFDVRFVPNPFYIPELREHSGENEDVREYVFKWDQTKEFLMKLEDMIEFLIPHYRTEGKTQLIIGIGCTGGMHRSVAIANKLTEVLKEKGNRVSVSHRDLKRR